MIHDFSEVFDTDNELWQRVLEIYAKNEKYEKKIVSGRNLHHKFPRSFSKKLGEPIDNDKDNLISLSLADHFLVHYYYYKLAKKGYRQSMATAFTFMAKKSIKYMSPDTAEMIAKDYEEALPISQKVWSEEERAIQAKYMKEYYNTHPEYRAAISPSGRKHTESTKKKISESVKKAITPELRKLRSESRKGISHPHKSGRKGIPISEFGKLFYEHYGFIGRDNAVLYRKELQYWREHHISSWEALNTHDVSTGT